MKATLTAVLIFTLSAGTALYAGGAFAAETSCKGQATEKKLAGAALNSFMTKCERDMKASCDTQASDKKLYGAAKASFTNKCVKDTVGT
jgi:hypothetical protein